jgi:hypothetical protein
MAGRIETKRRALGYLGLSAKNREKYGLGKDVGFWMIWLRI